MPLERASQSVGIQPDSTLGRHVKTVTTGGHFVMFDKDHQDHCFVKDERGMPMNLIMGVPEMDCFLANHTKDDLTYTYEIHESAADPSVRMNLALRFVSLKSGDDTRTWAQKEEQDSTTKARHHEQLEKLRKGKQW